MDFWHRWCFWLRCANILYHLRSHRRCDRVRARDVFGRHQSGECERRNAVPACSYSRNAGIEKHGSGGDGDARRRARRAVRGIHAEWADCGWVGGTGRVHRGSGVLAEVVWRQISDVMRNITPLSYGSERDPVSVLNLVAVVVPSFSESSHSMAIPISPEFSVSEIRSDLPFRSYHTKCPSLTSLSFPTINHAT